MHLEMIKEGSTILAPAYVHSYLRHCLLENKNAIPQVRITTLLSYVLDTFMEEDTSIYEYYQKLQSIKDTLTYYDANTISDYSFIKEMTSFIEELKRYDIDVDTLSENNPFQIENKKIVKALFPIDINIDVFKTQLQNVLENNDLSCVYIYDDNPSFYENTIYQSFIKKGATFIQNNVEVKEKYYYSALNQRQEVESIAQYIIKENIKAEHIHVALLNQSYIPYIHQIFKRYNIPYYILKEQEKSDILQRFLAFIEYYLNPGVETLENLFLTHALSHEYANEFVEYIRIHQKNLHDPFTIMENLEVSNDVLSTQEIDKLTTLENKAKQVQKEITPILDVMNNTESILTFLIEVDNYLCASHPFNKKEDRHALLSIRNEIKKAQNNLETKEELKLLSSILSNINSDITSSEKGICVSLFQYPICKKIQFVLGCIQENFPAFTAKSGIFDENYYEMLSYPTLEERYNFHLTQAMKNLQNCETLICFSPISTIDGKACESSLEIEEFMHGKAKRYALNHIYKQFKKDYVISPSDAKRLFVKKENKIHGSISSLEKYRKCPYSYYLKYGLRLSEPVDYTFNNAKCGTLIHYVFEHLINQYQKAYTKVSKEEVETILDKKIEEIVKVYPNEEALLHHMKKRLITTILLNLEILDEHENHSSLTPTHCEYQYTFDFPIDDTYSIALHGIIDRIDTNQDFLRVIDYKSSAHALKEENVFSAQQLQLITYLMIAQNKLQKRPLGAFYYSMALPTIKMEAGKFKKRPPSYLNYTKEDYYASFLKENRLHGWVVGSENYYIEPMDDNGSHIVGVSNSKNAGLTARTIYKFETLSEYLYEIYANLGKQILEGNIACESSKDACTYCPYARICMKANQVFEKEELVNVTSTLYLKGGRKDDDME